jgi:protein TonB
VSRKTDLVTVAIAIGLHVGLAATLIHGPQRARARPRPIEVEFRPPKPVVAAPAAPAAAAPAPRPTAARPVRRKLALVPPTPTPTPAPPPVRESAPPVRPAPVYGVAMESPTAASSPIAAPAGGSTIADPARPGRPDPNAATAASRAGGNGHHPFASELEVKQMPEIDTEACGKSIAYPVEAERNGIEGKVRLRVTLDERGRVSGVRVLSGLGHGLDQAAMYALKHRCKFTPAIARDGRPVPFVVESYTFNFELPR